jgi:hypothetical protein
MGAAEAKEKSSRPRRTVISKWTCGIPDRNIPPTPPHPLATDTFGLK